MNSLLADQHIQARHFTNVPGGRVTPTLIVMHTDEANERPDNAENVARFFATTDRLASAHYCCDNNSIVSCVDEEDVAFGAPGVNHNGVHIEQSGDASQRKADWSDDFSQTMIKEQVAPLVADIAKRNGIPIRHLTDDELRQGKRGIIGHVQASRVFGGTHTDPGANYPWGVLIRHAQAAAAPPKQVRFVLNDGEGHQLAQSAKADVGWKTESERLGIFFDNVKGRILRELRDDRDAVLRRVKT